MYREEKSLHHHRGNPPYFLGGLRLYGVYPSFQTYGVHPFPLFSKEIRDFRDSRDSSSEKTPFVMTPFSGPESCDYLCCKCTPQKASLHRFANGKNNGESLALLQGSFGPFGPKVANRVRKRVPRTSRPRGPKSPKRSRKRVKIDCFSTILALFRLRFGLFGPGGREGPGTRFRTLFATFGPKGPNDPCSGQKFSQKNNGKKGYQIEALTKFTEKK